MSEGKGLYEIIQDVTSLATWTIRIQGKNVGVVRMLRRIHSETYTAMIVVGGKRKNLEGTFKSLPAAARAVWETSRAEEMAESAA